eukprot:5134448-Amphidinium_carterae.1
MLWPKALHHRLMSCTPPQSDCLSAAVYSCGCNPSSVAVLCKRCGGAASQSAAVESRRHCTSAEVGGAAFMTLASAANRQWFCRTIPGLYKGRGCRRSRVLGEPGSHLGATRNCAPVARIESSMLIQAFTTTCGTHEGRVQGGQSVPVKVHGRGRDTLEPTEYGGRSANLIEHLKCTGVQAGIYLQEELRAGEVHRKVVGTQRLKGIGILHALRGPEERVFGIVITHELSETVDNGVGVSTQQISSINILHALRDTEGQLLEIVITHKLDGPVDKGCVVNTQRLKSIDILHALNDPGDQLLEIVIAHKLDGPVDKGCVVPIQRLKSIDILHALSDPEEQLLEIVITHRLDDPVDKGR